MHFKQFRDTIAAHFTAMTNNGQQLLRMDVDPDEIWDVYLNSFPEGSNPIYRERTEHDCSCCRHFIKQFGGLVIITPALDVLSIWDADIPDGPYAVVAAAMSEYVKSRAISRKFLHFERSVGTESNVEILDEGPSIRWSHFHLNLPANAIARNKDAIGTTLSRADSVTQVFLRGLEEIQPDAISTVMELIEQNSLYRGQEFLERLQGFQIIQTNYLSIEDLVKRDRYMWLNAFGVAEGITTLRNTVIGTLLTDLSEGVDLDRAVRSYEQKVAPANYKRPSALVTPRMIENARQKVIDLGLEDSLHRRFAVPQDLTVNNVIFADRSAKKAMGAFDQLSDETFVNVRTLSRVEEIGIDDFLHNVVPEAEAIDIIVENKHEPNFMSLIAPEHIDAPNLFPWNNGFSWAYKGDVTDSIAERVKKAGGRVEAALRCSLAWHNTDDLDIHVYEPAGAHIFYGQKRNPLTGGHLDVDMNVGSDLVRDAVENIAWPDLRKLHRGVYRLAVKNFTKRETEDVGFEVEIAFNGQMFDFARMQSPRDGEEIVVAEFEITADNEIKILKSIPQANTQRDIWGIKTNSFTRVSMILNSPNHWDGQDYGNRHTFFIVDGCRNPDKARGFFNEYLKSGLAEHRKVFELLGSKTMAEPTENQVSGVGFSSTKRSSVLCRVTGSFQRTMRVFF